MSSKKFEKKLKKTPMRINSALKLEKALWNADELDHKGTRDGFGVGLMEAAKKNSDVVGVCADLTESTRMHTFAEAYPERFIEVGVAEQNLVTVASGLAAEGKVPFAASFAAFSPGRNWEQIRTTICYNDQPVNVVGSHAGITVGEDGATHQMLEDIALMRALPNMIVVVPADAEEARKATLALAKDSRPSYLRLSRAKVPVVTTKQTPFELGKAYTYTKGTDVTLVTTGVLLYECLKVAAQLKGEISVEVVHVPTIKPLDEKTLLQSARKTGKVITVEEHQVHGGLGGAVAELLSQKHPVPMHIMGVQDRFGESGDGMKLLDTFGLSARHIAKACKKMVKK